jgi:hypothetical protein
MKNLILILTLLCAISATAAQRITATITVTNRAVTGDTLTVNASARYWTNANSSGTILTNLVGKNETATNLYNQIASYPYSGPVTLRYSTTNVILLTAQLDGTLAVSVAGTWATVSLSTQSGPQTYTALWPLENMAGATNRTNQGSSFVKGLSDYSTNAFATNSTALSNHITKGASPQQQVASPMHFAGLVRAGAGVALTNGFTSALTNINSVSSNHINFGNAIRSEGIGGNSLQVGSNALAVGSLSIAIGNGALASNTTTMALGIAAKATNSYAMAVGNDSISGGTDSLAVGRGAQAYGSGAQAIGQGAYAQGDNSLAIQAEVTGSGSISIGAGSGVSATNATALGTGSTVTHNDSTSIGKNATSTTTNQIRLGTSSDTISAPGIYDSPVTTNATLRGTNIINGRVDFTSRANTSLANGNNAGVVLGTNVYVRMSGPSASYTINGIAAEVDGSWHIAEFANPVNSLIIADNSGTDPAAANRIRTGTGADVTFTNNPVVLQFIYNASDARWKIVNWFR